MIKKLTILTVALGIIAYILFGSQLVLQAISGAEPHADNSNTEDQLTLARKAYLNARFSKNSSKANKLYKEAFKLYLPLAESGNDDAQFHLGLFYEDGLGITQDYRKAIDWYYKAAKQMNPYAQQSLGDIYRKGLGGTKDYNKALNWFLKASLQGCWGAQIDLAEMYEKGLGTTRDLVSAYAWYDVSLPLLPADLLREEIIRIRDELAEEMSSEQIQKAQTLSKEWSNSFPEEVPP